MPDTCRDNPVAQTVICFRSCLPFRSWSSLFIVAVRCADSCSSCYGVTTIPVNDAPCPGQLVSPVIAIVRGLPLRMLRADALHQMPKDLGCVDGDIGSSPVMRSAPMLWISISQPAWLSRSENDPSQMQDIVPFPATLNGSHVHHSSRVPTAAPALRFPAAILRSSSCVVASTEVT